MNRTSISTARSEPIGVTRRSSMARSSLDCSASGISPISSSRRVPPLAIWKKPRRVSLAPVKAPLRKPNSSDSNSSAGMAAQFTATKGLSRRGPEKWMERASSSLPTPVSPWMSTVVSMLGHRAQQLEDLLHGSRAGQDVAEGELLLVPAEGGAVGRPQLLELDGVPDDHQDLGRSRTA